MHKYEIGALYNPARTAWPESPQYNFRGGQHELTLSYRNPTEEEIASVQSGQARFAFAIEQGVIFFLYRFEPAVQWGDAPFSIHLVPKAERVIPEALPSAESRALLQIFLVDAATGILRAMRTVSLSHDFTRKLHKAITEQSTQPFSSTAHDAAIAATYARFKTKALLGRAIEQTRGGE